MSLTREIIRMECGEGYFYRGLELFNKGQVKHLDIEEESDDYIQLQSFIRGLYNQNYRVTVYIEREYDLFAGTPFAIDGHCSCLNEHNCEHVVASCLRYLHERVQSYGSLAPHSDWMNALASADVEHKPNADNQKKFLVFFLHFSREPGVIDLTVRRSYHKKRGGLAKPQGVLLSNYGYSAYEQYSDYDDLTIRLLNSHDIIYPDHYKIRGELGAIILQRVVKGGFCFFDSLDEDIPFDMSDPMPMQVKWQRESDESMQLVPVFDQPGVQLLLTDPPMYINAIEREVGFIQHPEYTTKQLRWILSAPILKATEIPEFSKTLTLKFPDLNIPKPTEVEVEYISANTFKPLLTLHKQKHGPRTFHAMTLQFIYGDWVLAVYPRSEQTTFEKHDRIFRINRDLNREWASTDRLTELGFTLVTDDFPKIFFYSPADSLSESATLWQRFMESNIPNLKQDGWEVRFHESFSLTFEKADTWYAELEQSDNEWFKLKFDLEIDGQKRPLLPLISEILETYSLDEIPDSIAIHIKDDRYISVTREQIAPVIQTLHELFDSQPDSSSLLISKYEAAQLAQLDQQHEQLQIRGARELLKLGRKLNNFSGIKRVAVPKALQTSLRKYQCRGLDWLQFLREYELNGILADDMGLGKTVQVLAHLLKEKKARRLIKPCLIVAPTSLMSNWRREVETFTPALNILTLQGGDRHDRFKQIEDYDLILSTYPLLPRDADYLIDQDWYYVILDEAQMVKNPKAKASRIIRQLKTRHRLCLTGTPMENHLGELWSIFDFLMPGFLGDERKFKTLYRTPIEKHGESEPTKRLARRIRPFLLRRTKDEVLDDLPSKTELIRSVTLGSAQAQLYESIRLSMEKKVRDAIASKGLARSHITILDALLKLRQVCCDPQILKLSQAKKVKRSAKLDLLMSILPEMLEEGRRVLLFSQFTSMLKIIEIELIKNKISYSKLTGQTRKREQVIDEFTSGQTEVFLISLKAGGLGLNLTEADTVIIYDPWWNPAVEQQAADRTYRIGQDKPVFVYKLMIENSVEERIFALKAKKQALAQGIYGDSSPKKDELFTKDDIRHLFQPLGGNGE